MSEGAATFTLRFWGVRGSIPAPGAPTSSYGGNTSCVELRTEQSLFILDAGTGIRPLGDALMKEAKGRPLNGNVFITHTHWDHIQGWPFFVPAYIPGNAFRVHGARGAGKTFEEVFRGLMDASYFPVDMGDMAAGLTFREVSQVPFECEGVKVESIFTHHPGMDLGYRFNKDGKSVTYLTDHEMYVGKEGPTDYAKKQDAFILDFAKDSDVLICDAQYTDEEYAAKRGWGHSRYRDIVRFGVESRAKRLILFHHDPSHDDAKMDLIAADAQDLLRQEGSDMALYVAREGLSLSL